MTEDSDYIAFKQELNQDLPDFDKRLSVFEKGAEQREEIAEALRAAKQRVADLEAKWQETTKF